MVELEKNFKILLVPSTPNLQTTYTVEAGCLRLLTSLLPTNPLTSSLQCLLL